MISQYRILEFKNKKKFGGMDLRKQGEDTQTNHDPNISSKMLITGIVPVLHLHIKNKGEFSK
jgi:hypothetical protein